MDHLTFSTIESSAVYAERLLSKEIIRLLRNMRCSGIVMVVATSGHPLIRACNIRPTFCATIELGLIQPKPPGEFSPDQKRAYSAAARALYLESAVLQELLSHDPILAFHPKSEVFSEKEKKAKGSCNSSRAFAVAVVGASPETNSSIEKLFLRGMEVFMRMLAEEHAITGSLPTPYSVRSFLQATLGRLAGQNPVRIPAKKMAEIRLLAVA